MFQIAVNHACHASVERSLPSMPLRRVHRSIASLLPIALIFLVAAPARGEVGDLDPGFGAGGIVVAPFADRQSLNLAVALQPDGRIVAAGGMWESGSILHDVSVVRFHEDGSLDESFGVDGIAAPPGGTGHDDARALVLQNDGKIVIAGRTRLVPEQGDMVLFRMNPDGSMDESFGDAGQVRTSFSPYEDFATALALQPDGKLVAAGFSITDPSGFPDFDPKFQLVVARYLENGDLDPSFGDGGKAAVSHGEILEAHAIVIQPDGRIAVAGASFGYNGNGWDSAVVRFDSDGSLDESFGQGGIVVTRVGGSVEPGTLCDTRSNWLNSIALQPDGHLVAGGYSSTRTGCGDDRFVFTLIRYRPDGSLDPTFSGDGIATEAVAEDCSGPTCWIDWDEVHSIALQADGRIVAAGYTSNGREDFRLAILRFLPDGRVDTTFGESGRIVGQVDGSSAIANAIALQENGMIVVSAWLDDGRGGRWAMLRYLNDPACAATPRPDCLPGGTAPEVKIYDNALRSRQRVLFKWRRDSLPFPEETSPLRSTRTAICVYDEDSRVVATSARMTRSMRNAVVRGKNLAGVRLRRTLGFPVVTQLATIDGQCWESSFSAVHARSNDGTRFSARIREP